MQNTFLAKTFTCKYSGFACEYIQHQKPYILVSFGQKINFKQRTELTNGRRAENKSQEKQGFHLDAGQ